MKLLRVSRFGGGLTGFLIVLLLLFLSSPSMFAAGDILINEVMWDGEEYIELFNTSSEQVSLSFWQITRQQTEEGPEEIIVTFSEDDAIAARQYFLIIKNSKAAPTYNKTAVGLTLHNEGDLVQLRDSQGQIVDSANRFGAWFAGQNTTTGIAMERIEAGSDGMAAASWQTSSGVVGGRQGTPGQVNSGGVTETEEDESSVSPQVYSDKIIINEFLTNPIGEDTAGEFIELYNSGSEVVDISGWGIDDGDTGSKEYIFPSGTVVSGNSYLLLKWSQSKITLNNNGDQITLRDPDATVRSHAQYSQVVPEGQSFNRTTDGAYVLSSTITSGSTNIITIPSATPVKTPTISTSSKTTTPTTSPETVATYSNEVRVNEFLSNPEGDDTQIEFIELINLGKTAINLTSWQLDDAEGGSRPFSLTAADVLKPGEIKSWRRSQTAIALNNDKDSVRLIDPAGRVISFYEYFETVPEGQSYSRNQIGDFELTLVVTEGKANVFSGESPGQVAGSTTASDKKSSRVSSSALKPSNQILTNSPVISTLVAIESTEDKQGSVLDAPTKTTEISSKRSKVKQVAGIAIAIISVLIIVVNIFFNNQPVWKTFGRNKTERQT